MKLALERDRSLKNLRREKQLQVTEENNKASLEKRRFEKTINQLDGNDPKRLKDIYSGNELNQPKNFEKVSLEIAQNLKKTQIEKNLLQSEGLKNKAGLQIKSSPIPDRYLDDPNDIKRKAREDELKNRLAIVESLRQKEKNGKEFKMKLQPPQAYEPIEYEKNMKKFYGVDEGLSPKINNGNAYDQELPYSSEFKQMDGVSLQPLRFAKNNLKSLSHDPITGAINTYMVNRPKPRTLGTKAPEVFPGKIYDSPAPVEYELPKHTKKAPKHQIFNPLTGEARTIIVEKQQFYNAYPTDKAENGFNITEKIGKSKNPAEIPADNPPPIFKGMGYKKSSIFT